MAASIPSHAAWFDLNTVHDLETRGLPEFFSPDAVLKTAKNYKQARNFIVETYREQPTLYLSVTECRRHLSLDVSSVMRIHQFLEHWGLINYLAQQPQGSGAPLNGNVVLDGPAGPSVSAILSRKRPLPEGTGLSTRVDVFAGGASNGTAAEEWSNEATLALLEGVEQFEDRWEDVAAHVGKTPEQCVRQFLRLPIEEPYQPEVLLGGSALVGDAANSTAIDPQLCQLSLLAAAVKGSASGDAAESGAIEHAASTAASSMHEAARGVLEAVQQRAQQQLAEEEQEMQRLVASAVDTQLQRLEQKLAMLDDVASLLQREREQLDRKRSQIFAERLQLERRRVHPPSAAPAAHGVVAVSATTPAPPTE